MLLGDPFQRARRSAVIAGAGLHETREVKRLRHMPLVNAFVQLKLQGVR